jgi:hypothetical protein
MTNGGVDQLMNTFHWLIKKYIQRASHLKIEIPAPSSDNSSDKKEPEDSQLSRLALGITSYGKLIKAVTNSSYIMNSPITTNMMTMQNLPNQKGVSTKTGKMVTRSGPFDPHKFNQDLCDKFAHLIAPLWNEDIKILPSTFMVSLIQISKQLLDNHQNGATATVTTKPKEKEAVAAPAFVPDPALVTQLMEMGFSKSHVEDALRQIGANNGGVATEWLLNNPEEIVPETIVTGNEDDSNEDQELAMALAMSLGVDTMAHMSSTPTTATTPAVTPITPITTTPIKEDKKEIAPVESAYDILRNSLVNMSFDVLSQQEVPRNFLEIS